MLYPKLISLTLNLITYGPTSTRIRYQTPRSHHFPRHTPASSSQYSKVFTHPVSLATPIGGYGAVAAYCVFLAFAKNRAVDPNGSSTIESFNKRANVRYLNTSVGEMRPYSDCRPTNQPNRLGNKTRPHPSSERPRQKDVHQPRQNKMSRLAGTPARRRKIS